MLNGESLEQLYVVPLVRVAGEQICLPLKQCVCQIIIDFVDRL